LAPAGVSPRIVFMSNGSDEAGNTYADILRAGVEQLVRVWRDESENPGDEAPASVPRWSGRTRSCAGRTPRSTA
jgi:malonyl-CoA reductase/3-hydroxypropionate dehydrogenase (NADP+)